MKQKFIVASVLVAFSLPVSAQLKVDKTKQATSQQAKSEPGRLLASLAGALKPATFTSSYAKQKSSFLNSTQKITEGASLAKNTVMFIKFIKPEKFKEGSNVDKYLQSAASTTTLKQAGELLEAIETGLKPDAKTSMWGLSRASWLSDIQKLKKS